MKFRRAAIAVSAAAMLVLAGCGSDSEDGSSSDPSNAAETSDSAAESTESTEEPTSDSGGDDGTSQGNAGGALTAASFSSETTQAQHDAESTHVEMEAETQGQTVSMSGDMQLAASMEDVGFDLEMGSSGQQASMILVDGVLYSNFGKSTQDKYVKVELDDPNNPMGAFFSQLIGQADPAGITRAFDGAIKGFKAVGSAEVDGVATTQYRVTVGTREVLSKTLGKESLKMMQGSMGKLPKQLTYDIWVGDDDNLPRRMEYSIAGSSVRMDMSQWGEPVDIQAPPESEISDKDPFATTPTP